MTSKQYYNSKVNKNDLTSSLEAEVELLKHDISLAEHRILKSQQFVAMDKGFTSPAISKGSPPPANRNQVPAYEVMAQKNSSTWMKQFAVNRRRDDPCVAVSDKPGLMDYDKAKWVSPIDRTKRSRLPPNPFDDPLDKCPDSSFNLDCSSSVISLDFGLISPKKNWSSPPQRIERAQNREWSPHRVIDRPNPENSPGNWISIKESCQQSPAVGIANVATEQPVSLCPVQGPRSASQSTYVVPERVCVPVPSQVESPPIKKRSVLLDYDPDRGGGTVTGVSGPSGTSSGVHEGGSRKKKSAARVAETSETTNLVRNEEDVRRVVNSVGRVVKKSVLGDYQGPTFGKSLDRHVGGNEKENHPQTESTTKTKKTGLNAKVKAKTSRSVTAKLSPASKKTEETNENETTRPAIVGEVERNQIQVDENQDGDEGKDNLAASTQKMILELKNILGDGEKPDDEDKVVAGKSKIARLKKRPAPPRVIEDKQEIVLEKKKRNIDTKIVQEFIKNQKQKRMEQIKTEKKSKAEERESIKKKLEELRIKTLKLASQSKKKKLPQGTIKTVDPATEDDITMSLGLKQVKPKVSYNESISNLKKKVTSASKVPAVKIVEPAPEMDNSLSDKGTDERVEPTETIQAEPEVKQESGRSQLTFPEDLKLMDFNLRKNDLNYTLRKLTETLHMKIEEKEKQLRSRPTSVTSKSIKDSVSVVSQESAKTVKTIPDQNNRQCVTVDLETIHTLKEDIKKISENFKVLHQIIVEKTDLSEKKLEKKVERLERKTEDVGKPPAAAEPSSPKCESEEFPSWLATVLPKPHPYTVFTAFRNKLNIQLSNPPSSASPNKSPSSVGPELKKPETHLEPPSHHTSNVHPNKSVITIRSSKTTTGSPGENYWSLKEDSGSELSSSILDSDKNSLANLRAGSKTVSVTSSKPTTQGSDVVSLTSSIITEITTKSIQLPSSRESVLPKSSSVNLCEIGGNLDLVTPDVKLVAMDLTCKKLDTSSKNLNLAKDPSSSSLSTKNSMLSDVPQEELNNFDGKSVKGEQKSDSTITEMIHNLSESDKSAKSVKVTNKNTVQNAVQRKEDVQSRRIYFQPEMLHLQFQAELTLLETFQQSLSHFLEAERLKTLSEVSKIVYEKSVNTEKVQAKEDQAVQTTFVKESEPSTEEEVASTDEEDTECVKTEMNFSEDEPDPQLKQEPVKTETDAAGPISSSEIIAEDVKTMEIPEELSVSSKDVTDSDVKSKKTSSRQKESDPIDFSNEQNGISFQMLDRMIKDEELRSEHQLALIRLREKTLNEKVKAELTFLEMKKRALKQGGGVDDEQSVSAIKKKQRGILLKFQSEKEEIERLKKMHKIASEERRIMIKQQKQIQQMQLSTKDMIIRLRGREKSPFKKSPVKVKPVKAYDSQSDIQENLEVPMSDSILTESVFSMNESGRQSKGTDNEISTENCSSDEDSEILRKTKKTIERKITDTLNSPIKAKKMSPTAGHRHSVDELLSWSKRLEEKENRLKELERQTMDATDSAKPRVTKAFKSHVAKVSVRDRSTSPFPDNFHSLTEKSVSTGVEVEATVTKDIPESLVKLDKSKKSEGSQTHTETTASEDIPEQFSKGNANGSTIKTAEYNSESFESLSSSETPKVKLASARVRHSENEKPCKSIPIKLSLSPRIQGSKKRCSSGSDESVNLSHTETASEQSDLESRIAALHEQLRKRKLEAERLRREQKKVQRERLKVKEQSLLQQIQAYDEYIQKKKQELEQEYEQSAKAISKPVIKQPKVAEKSSLKRQEHLLPAEGDKLKFYPRLAGKGKEKSTPSDKVTESDSEIPEIPDIAKDFSESIGEDIKTSQTSNLKSSDAVDEAIESRIEEEKEVQDVVVDAEGSLHEISEGIQSSRTSPELSTQPDVVTEEGSQSESEDQSVSIKTTLQSPEKPDTEIGDVRETTQTDDVEKEQKDNRESTTNDNTYQSDSFESDFEEEEKEVGEEEEDEEEEAKEATAEISPKVCKSSKKSTESEVETDIPSEVPSSVSAKKLREEKIKESENEESGNSIMSPSVDETLTEKVGEEGEEEEEEDEKEAKEEQQYDEEEEETSGEIKSELSEEVVESRKTTEKTDAISESIILDLLTESVNVFTRRQCEIERRERENNSNLEKLSNGLTRDIMTEAIDDVLTIYHQKSRFTNAADDDDEPISPEKITTDIRQRIYEILSQGTEVKESLQRPQDLMVTTYDVTPTRTPPDEDDMPDRETFLQSLNANAGKEKSDKKVFPQADLNQVEKRRDALTQEWFVDDFGLNRTRKEAEELRLQQLQIEEEIQQLQAQQEQVPYFYLREIPNKPPPPYTPPGKPLTEISTSESDIASITSSAVQIVADELGRGKAIGDIEPTSEYYGNVVSEHVKCYKLFLFDLAKHIIEDVLRQKECKNKSLVPWLRTRNKLSAYKYHSIERTFESLDEFVRKQVMILFGFGKKVGKESMIMKCFKKKRDHVDDILVYEFKEEESQWTEFDEDQVTLKNEVTTAILDGLLDESTHILSDIFNKRLTKSAESAE